MEQQPPDIFSVTRDDPRYLQQLRAEEEFWDSRVETPLSRTPRPAIQRYLNERLTGRSDRQWFEVTSDHGEFRRGCVLGAGPGHVESYLLGRHRELNLTVYDISGGALARLQSRLEKEFPARAEMRQEDLNFVTLPANSYDLIIANECLHHLVNLEHVAFQINNALTPDGFFFMEDTVGESYFQFSEEKKRLFETLVDATQDDPGRALPIQWPDRGSWAFSPFESVRSGEILDVFGRYLREVRVRTAGALLALTLIAAPGSGSPQTGGGRFRRLRRLARAGRALRARLLRPKLDIARGRAREELLFALDRIVCEAGYLQPGLAFAIYRKRGTGGASG